MFAMKDSRIAGRYSMTRKVTNTQNSFPLTRKSRRRARGVVAVTVRRMAPMMMTTTTMVRKPSRMSLHSHSNFVKDYTSSAPSSCVFVLPGVLLISPPPRPPTVHTHPPTIHHPCLPPSHRPGGSEREHARRYVAVNKQQTRNKGANQASTDGRQPQHKSPLSDVVFSLWRARSAGQGRRAESAQLFAREIAFRSSSNWYWGRGG